MRGVVGQFLGVDGGRAFIGRVPALPRPTSMISASPIW
jgi:hypothetical protein